MKTKIILCLGLFTAFFTLPSAFAQSGYVAPRSGNNGTTGTQRSSAASAEVRDIANLRSDFSILQEENQKLNMRMEMLERELEARDARLQELQNLVHLLNEQIVANDKMYRERLAQLEKGLAAERQQSQKELTDLATNISKELSNRPSGGGSTATAKPSTSYYEFKVEAGDTLSSIAKAAGISWQELKQFNGLDSDVIRPGQILKIPKK